MARGARSTYETRRARPPVRHKHDAPAVTVDGLSVGFGEILALDDITFRLNAGERLAIVGPNGAGKSTLLRTVAGLLTPAVGTVRIHGHPPQGHVCIAYVPQRSEVDARFPVTVFDVVAMGRIGRLGPFRRLTGGDREIVRRAMEQVGLTPLTGRSLDALSGGQRQRMFVARALAQESDVILMDEPFSGLDVQSREDLIEILQSLKSAGVTLLVALHDLGLASSAFDRLLLLKGSSLGFGSPSEVLTETAMQRAYGSCLRMVQTETGTLVVHDTACVGGPS